MFLNASNVKIAVIGLGYVGLPLAIEFSKLFSVIGFDLNNKRIDELKSNLDITGETSKHNLASSKDIIYSNNFDDTKDANFYIICVPTPIDTDNNPDLNPIKFATELVAKNLSEGDIVVYESTVYPGLTEEYCVPILEKISKLRFNEDFYCGYSPERINPGDKKHTLTDIIKITSGSTKESALFIDSIYSKIIKAGTHLAPNIKVAEAAKVIENTQRDLNIGLINELSIIFNKLNINTEDVLDAASTKWNFIKFSPGLVGGHCIGVDPYYLTSRSIDAGYNPEIILAGRRLNDGMGSYVASQLITKMKLENIPIKGSNILILGLTFKENCSDIRNTKVFDIANKLKENECKVEIYDPFVQQNLIKGWNLLKNLSNKLNFYNAIIIAVGHDEFKSMGIDNIRKNGKENSIIYDLKWLFSEDKTDMRL